MVVEADFPHRCDRLIFKQRAHGGQLGTPIAVINGHRSGVLLDQALRVDADGCVEVRCTVRQFQHADGIAGVGGTFQHAHHAARRQSLQQRGAVSIKLTRGIVRVGVKNVRHALASCGARLTR